MKTGLKISIRDRWRLWRILRKAVAAKVVLKYNANLVEGIYILAYMGCHSDKWQEVVDRAHPEEHTFYRVGKDGMGTCVAGKYIARYCNEGIYILYRRKNLVNKTLEG